MRRRRRPDSAKLEDRYVALRADYERAAAEIADLEREVEELEEQRALAKHLGRGDLDRIENRLHKSGVRLIDVSAEQDELRRALNVLANEIATARRVEAIDRRVEATDRRQQTAADVENAQKALDRALDDDADAVAAVESAERDANQTEAFAADVGAAIKRGAADPLADANATRGRHKQAERKREREQVSWAARQILGGSPTKLVLENIPAPLREQVMAEVAEERSETPGDKRRRLIEEAKRTGQGLILNGEVVVHPKRDPAPPIAATRIK